LPADASLSVDGKAVPRGSEMPTIVTPALKPGQDYVYTFNAQATRSGRVLSQTKRVIVRAGNEATVNFGDLTTPAVEQFTASPTHVIVKLPTEAQLFVDGVPCTLTSDTRSFDTPTLEPGKAYSYRLRAEIVRDGQTFSDNRRLTVRSGEPATVDFGDLRPVRTASR
jgi:uncharacterized protein (TIGR03000 family)